MSFSCSFNLEWRVLTLSICWRFEFCKELKDTLMCILWGGIRTLPQGCIIVSWLLLHCFSIPSLPWWLLLLSCVELFAIPWTAWRQALLSFTISWSLLNSCPLSQWCHSTISSSVALFSCPQSFPASFLSQLFASGGQSIGASASASVLPMKRWFPLGLTGLISLLSKRILKSLLQHHSIENISSSVLSLLYGPTLTAVLEKP